MGFGKLLDLHLWRRDAIGIWPLISTSTYEHLFLFHSWIEK